MRSLVAAVPGNFIEFYLFGWFLRRRFSWARYIKASQLALLLANTIVAFLYVFFRSFVEASYPETFRQAWIPISLGLVVWWYVTMLPFVLLLGPPIIRAISLAFPGIISNEIKSSSVRTELPRRSFAVALLLPGLLMLLIGLATVYTDPGFMIATGFAPSPLILIGIRVMFLASGVILLTLGLAVLAIAKIRPR